MKYKSAFFFCCCFAFCLFGGGDGGGGRYIWRAIKSAVYSCSSSPLLLPSSLNLNTTQSQIISVGEQQISHIGFTKLRLL